MEQVKIGWASRDISTTKPVNIPGQFHMRISKGVMDPVTVNALVLDSGEDQAIFLSCDIVVLRNGLQDLVREKLAQCAPEDFDAIWDEFVGKLADLPLAEYEQLVTQMAQESAPNYQN